MDDPNQIDERPPGWRQRADRVLATVFGISLVLAIGALLYFAGTIAKEREDALTQQQRSYEVITLARQLDASIARAQMDLARYVVGMDKNVGRVYQERWRTATNELTALRQATRHDPVQVALIEKLDEAFRERGAVLSDIALRTAYDQKLPALGKFYQASKDRNLGRIGSLIEQIIERENERLTQHGTDAERASASLATIGTTYRVVALALLVTVLTAAWMVRTAIRERRYQQRLVDEEFRRNEELRAAVAARTSELEHAYEKLKRESADRERIEEDLRQMQKLEAVGQLTGGIAHDFNNMLSVVVGGIELTRRRIDENEEAARHLDNALEGANRASALTRRLLAFSRAEPNLPESWDPDGLVRGMVEMLDRSIGDQIAVRLDLNCPEWRIHADRHQFENALLNLALNARDAMDGRGELTIRSHQTWLRHNEIGECAAGEYACLCVIDRGSGMTPEVQNRVFEPFFTTKGAGKGTGLGLSQVFGFMGQCGGQIRILSEPDTGTEVQLFFPRHVAVGKIGSDRKNSGKQPVGQSSPGDAAIGLTVLVVEDDPRVLAQTRAALLELGQIPLTCDHPRSALALIESRSDIDIILSDVLMPDMTGPEMIASLPSQFRAIPVIFVTGYAGDSAETGTFEGHQLLRKPYTLAGLTQALAEAASRLPGSAAGAARG